jgi:hypothetical protein
MAPPQQDVSIQILPSGPELQINAQLYLALLRSHMMCLHSSVMLKSLVIPSLHVIILFTGLASTEKLKIILGGNIKAK